MKRILVTGFTSNRGGIETFVINYVKAIKKFQKDVQFDVLGYEKHPAFEQEIRDFGGEVFMIPSPRHPDSRKKLDHFFRENAEKYDVLWCNKCDVANIDYLIYAHKYGIPKRILHSHNSANMHQGVRGILFGCLHRMNRKKAARLATDYWACSDFAAKWFYDDHIIRSSRYHFIPNAVATSQFAYSEKVRAEYRNKLGLKDELLIGNVGRFSYQKNHEFVFAIFHAILQQRPDAKLLLIGVGEKMQFFRQQAKEMGMQNSIIFLGKSAEVPQWMQAMDCFVLPSRFEGLPVVAIEAQAAGLPVVASSEGITPQTKLLENFHFLPLSDSPEVWAKEILGMDYTRQDCSEIIRQKGFEIESAAKNLWSLLSQNG